MIPLSILTTILFGLNQSLYFESPSCSIEFSLYNAGFEVEGTLEVIRAEINFDPRNLENSVMFFVADPSSVKTGIGIRDKHLVRGDFFDVKNHPEIIVRSKSFDRKNKNEFVGKFDITIKSITKEIAIPFTLEKKKDGNHYRANFTINRLDFKVGEESPTIDDEVRIIVTVGT